ncbi:MAG TPA: hypothetical protein VLF91_05015 [Candidatus Saccharimonadales bacterium]|nr:hypothetical protein [Candidatus Saccharimonadales bacterium]
MAALHNRKGGEFYQSLARLRTEALERSNERGRRRRIGSLTFGRACAGWQSAAGGEVHLEDKGVRIGKFALASQHPTKLEIWGTAESGGIDLKTFIMDLDEAGNIEVTYGLLALDSLHDRFKNKRALYAERRLGLTVPSDEDTALLYAELERGASGEYRWEYDS